MNYKKYEQHITDYNNELLSRGLKCLKRYKIDESLMTPKDIKGNAHALGVFTDEGVYSDFKTVGAKRYMTVKEETNFK